MVQDRFEGPYEATEICEKIQNRSIGQQALVRRENEERWTPANEVLEFAAAFGTRRELPAQAVAPRLDTMVVREVRYDPSILRKFATELYNEADSVLIAAAVRGFAIWGGISVVCGYVMSDTGDGRTTTAIIVGCGGGLVGAFVGRLGALAQANSLRVQAQTALCQVEIERNTRVAKSPDER